MEIDVKLKELRPEDFELLSQRYGFFDTPKTLELVGKKLGITRERVRQKQVRALRRLREILNDDCDLELVLNRITEAAKNNVPLYKMKGFSRNFKDDSITMILIDVFFQDNIKIFTSQKLKNPILICQKEEAKIKDNIVNIKDILEIQKEYVFINEIANFLNCSENLVREYKMLIFKGERVALFNNKNIFLDRLSIFENIFKENPYKIFDKQEILELMEIREGQLRGLIDRAESVVCLEKSKYAYNENYRGGSSIKLVYDFLSEAEKPMTFKSIMSLIKKERPFIKEGSVKAAIKLSDEIDEIDNNLFALKKWGYESRKKEFRINKYKYRLEDSLEEIFKEHVEDFLSVRDLKKYLFEKYENDVSSDDSSIYVSLNKLIDRGSIFKITRGRSAYYKKK